MSITRSNMGLIGATGPTGVTGPAGATGVTGPGPTVGTWTAVTFSNSWANYGGGWQVAQYRKVGDIVYLRGLITAGSNGAAAFTLPSGFRPPSSSGELWIVLTDTGGNRLDVAPGGGVIPSGGGGGGHWCSISGVSFSVTA